LFGDNFVGPDPRSGLQTVRSGNAPYILCKFIYFVCISSASADLSWSCYQGATRLSIEIPRVLAGKPDPSGWCIRAGEKFIFLRLTKAG
jgi:hypothetical protein